MKRHLLQWVLILIAGLVLLVPVQAQNEQFTLPVFSRQAYVLCDRAMDRLQVVEAGFPVESTSTTIGPIEQIIIAIDTSVSMKHLIPTTPDNVRKSLPDQPPIPIMVAVFNEQVEVLCDFTTSHDVLDETLKKVHVSDRSTAIFEAIRTFQTYAQQKRTHLILLTDGADTTYRKVHVPEMLLSTNLVVSYLNWGYRDQKLHIDEPGANRQALDFPETEKSSKETSASHSKKTSNHRVEVGPDDAVSIVSERTGGDVMNFVKWNELVDYLKRRLKMVGVLHQLSWKTENPECSFQILDSDGAMTGAMKGKATYRRHW